MSDVPAARTALLEVDFQGWIIDLAHDPVVLERVAATRASLRDRGALVIVSRYLSRDPDDPMRSDPAHPGAALHPDFRPGDGDILLTKHGRDLFDEPDAAAALTDHGITDVVITGLVTDHGVRLAALSALALGHRVTVVADSCAGTSREAHDATLRELATAGVTVVASAAQIAPGIDVELRA